MLTARLAGSLGVVILLAAPGCLTDESHKPAPQPSSYPDLQYFRDCNAIADMPGASIPCPSPQIDAQVASDLGPEWRCLNRIQGIDPEESFGWRAHAADNRIAFTYSGYQNEAGLHGAIRMAQGDAEELVHWRSDASGQAIIMPETFEATQTIEFEAAVFGIEYEFDAIHPSLDVPLTANTVEPAWSFTDSIEMMHRASWAEAQWHFANRIERQGGYSTVEGFAVDGADFDFRVDITQRIFATGTVAPTASCMPPARHLP